MTTKPLRLNPAQLLSIIHPVRMGVHIWGRGTGKSFGPMGWESQLVAHQMPRATFSFVGPTYVDLMTNTLPTTLAAWRALGYREYDHRYPRKGGNFCIGVRPPAHWLKPYLPPLRYEHFISWDTGAGFHLVSQDRKGTDRGGSVDGVFADEGLKLKKEQFEQESLSTIRGNRHHFGHNPRHQLIRLCSSKPVSSKGQWMLDYAKYYEEDGHQYGPTQRVIADLQLELIDTNSLQHRQDLWQEIKKLRELINYYPKGNELLYTEANGFSNLTNLGLNYFTDKRLSMTESTFLVEILNKSLAGIEGGFYGKLVERIHTYTDSYNYTFLDSQGYQLSELDCRRDADLLPNLPVRIGVDWGANINFMCIAQDQSSGRKRLLRYLNNLYVKHPRILDDVFHEFVRYYRFHPTKRVFFHFDHTGTNRQPNSTMTYYEQATKILVEAGWVVTQCFNTRNIDPEYRYYLWNKCLEEQDPELPMVRFNANNCRETLTSMQLTPVIQGSKGYKKDKSSERKKDIPQELATHGGDAADTILGSLATLKQEEAFIDFTTM